MKKINKIGIAIGVLLILAFAYMNHRYEVVAFHPFFGSDDADLKVMTWNVHCPNGTDSVRQVRIAEVILKEDADFVLLNEFYQDSCKVIDSLLRIRYKFTEEYQSHQKCGDIFFSKRKMSNSGHVWIPIVGKAIQTIKATIAVGTDSVQILGLHMASNSSDGSAVVNGLDSLKKIDVFYQRYKSAQDSRVFQAHWTKVNMMESEHPIVVMGDMNDFSCSAPLDTLVNAGMKDAWWEGGTGYGCTFHEGWMILRIDHILHTPELRLTNVRVVDVGNMSDHNPVVASFKMVK